MPRLYDVSNDPGETTYLDHNSQLYKDVSDSVLNAIVSHKDSIETVESQFTWSKTRPRLSWQPCCNGIFPFQCMCSDPKFQL